MKKGFIVKISVLFTWMLLWIEVEFTTSNLETFCYENIFLNISAIQQKVIFFLILVRLSLQENSKCNNRNNISPVIHSNNLLPLSLSLLSLSLTLTLPGGL